MSSLDLKPKSTAEIDHRKAVLSLRWLLVILASYLTLFSYLGTDGFPVVFGFVLAFSVSNILLMMVPRREFTGKRTQLAIVLLDVAFVTGTLYLLRIPGEYLYIVFAG